MDNERLHERIHFLGKKNVGPNDPEPGSPPPIKDPQPGEPEPNDPAPERRDPDPAEGPNREKLFLSDRLSSLMNSQLLSGDINSREAHLASDGSSIKQ